MTSVNKISYEVYNPQYTHCSLPILSSDERPKKLFKCDRPHDLTHVGHVTSPLGRQEMMDSLSNQMLTVNPMDWHLRTCVRRASDNSGRSRRPIKSRDFPAGRPTNVGFASENTESDRRNCPKVAILTGNYTHLLFCFC